MKTFSHVTGKEHYKQEKQMSWNADQDRHIARAVGRAIRHVRRVAIRPHISTDRDERLNQFVVSIRRELVQLKNSTIISESAYSQLLEVLGNKSNWYDIGEPNLACRSVLSTAPSTGTYNYRSPSFGAPVTITLDDMKRWIKLSRHLETETEAQAYDIATDMEEIERGIGSLEESVDEVRRINQEGDQLAHQLAVLFS